MDNERAFKMFESIAKTLEEGFKEMGKALRGNTRDKNLPHCVNAKKELNRR